MKVPKANALGEPGRGFYYLMEGLAEERLISAVGSIANARKAFDITRAYVQSETLTGARTPRAAAERRFRQVERQTDENEAG